MVKKELEEFASRHNVSSANGAISKLVLHATNIRVAEERRHLPLPRKIGERLQAKSSRDYQLEYVLCDYKREGDVYSELFGIDCSGFDSAVKDLVETSYWKFIE
jgi:hypothetical protein